jgi:hypothetical protein
VQKPDGADLDQVVVGLSAPAEALCEVMNEWQVRLDDRSPQRPVARVCGRHGGERDQSMVDPRIGHLWTVAGLLASQGIGADGFVATGDSIAGHDALDRSTRQRFAQVPLRRRAMQKAQPGICGFWAGCHSGPRPT